ncbi:hypothetical protein Sjap_022031 [Stephania japonica]|uniref:Uncharacterized protein n=1 Tax=Stephania japonica TaxID=461633 RepID=A0AAP0EWW4_9MAGN
MQRDPVRTSRGVCNEHILYPKSPARIQVDRPSLSSRKRFLDQGCRPRLRSRAGRLLHCRRHLRLTGNAVHPSLTPTARDNAASASNPATTPAMRLFTLTSPRQRHRAASPSTQYNRLPSLYSSRRLPASSSSSFNGEDGGGVWIFWRVGQMTKIPTRFLSIT